MRKLFALFLAVLLTAQTFTPAWAETVSDTAEPTEAAQTVKAAEETEAAEAAEPTEAVEVTEATEAAQAAEATETTDPTEADADPQPVRVRFACTPENLTLVVYPAEADIDQAIDPEEDGTYLLLPGDYAYLAAAEGFAPTEGRFTVTDGEFPVEITLAPEETEPEANTLEEDAATSGTCGDNLTWVLDEDGVLTISGSGEMTDYISSDVPWYPYRSHITAVVLESGVTSIGKSAFYNCGSMTSVTIPESVARIGEDAFEFCKSLTSVTIPGSEVRVGRNAFYGCSAITDVYYNGSRMCWSSSTGLPTTAKVHYASIAYGTCGDNLTWTLDNDGLLTVSGTGKIVGRPWNDYDYYVTSIVIEPGVTEIPDYSFSFSSTKVSSVTIPGTVTKIGKPNFKEFRYLKDIYYGGSETQWESFNLGLSWTVKMHYAYPGSGTCGTDVTWLLEYSGLLTISGSGKMTEFKSGEAPWYKKRDLVTTVVVEPGVKSIGGYAFYYCGKMTSATIPESVWSVTSTAFANCAALTDIYYGGSKMDWDSSKVELGSNVTVHCANLGSGTCGKELNWLLDNDGTMTISGSGPMVDRTSTNYTSASWHRCRAEIQSVVMESGATAIGAYAFYNCTALTSVTVPASVSQIGANAFSGCAALADVFYDGSRLQWDSLGAELDSNVTIHCTDLGSGTCGENLTWQLSNDGILTISGSGNMTDYSEISYNGTRAADTPWYPYREQITSVVLESGVTSIGSAAFFQCGMYSVTIPDGVTSIGDWALSFCNNLPSITIPASVTSIGGWDIYTCAALTDIYYGGSLMQWDSFAVGGGEGKTVHCANVGSGTCGGSVTWLLDNEGTLTISGSGAMTNYSYGTHAPWYNYRSLIKTAVLESGVTSIGNLALYNCSELTSVTIPSSVTGIEKYPFSGCAALTDVHYDGSRMQWSKLGVSVESNVTVHCTSLGSGTCGDGLTWLLDNDGVLTISGSGAMTDYSSGSKVPWSQYKAEITAAVIEPGVTSVGNYALYDCDGLTSVTLPEGLAGIGSDAFSYCSSLTSVTIPGSVTSIGEYAFSYCPALTDIYFGGSRMTWDTIGGSIGSWVTVHCVNYGSGTCGDSLTWLMDNDGVLTISGSGKMTDYTYGARAPWAQYRKQVTKIVLESGVTSIGSYAFYECTGLTNLTIPNGVESIGGNAFEICTGLTGVAFPDSVTSIGETAFSGCTSLTGVLLPERVTRIGGSAFESCSALTSVTIPEGVTSIEEGTFYNCTGLTYVGIPKNVTSIGRSAFENCAGLTELIIPAGVTSIGSYAFEDCTGLTELIIPADVTSIGSYAFKDCTGLTELTIPAGVTSIGTGAFNGCTALTDIYYDGTLANWETINKSTTGSAVIHYTNIGSGTCGVNLTWLLNDDGVLTISGSGEMKDYGYSKENAPWYPWRERVLTVVFPETLSYIGSYAFRDCTKLTSITVPASVVRISSNAFSGCSGMTDVYYDGSLKDWNAVNRGAISGAVIHCTCIDSGTCGENLTWLLDNDGVLTISGSGTMEDYFSYSKDSSAPWYSWRDRIKSLVLEEGLSSISRCAFYGCGSLTEAVLPESLKEVGDYAFRDAGLKTVVFKGNAPKLGQSAFYGLSAEVCYPAGNATWWDTAFYSYRGQPVWKVSAPTMAEPELLSVENTAQGAALKWSPVSGAQRYRVLYRQDGDTGWTTAGDTADTGFTITGLNSGNTYSFSVCCCSDSKAVTGNYDTVGLRVFYVEAPEISSVSTTLKGVEVTWTAVNGAEKYRLFYKPDGGDWKSAGDTTDTTFTVTGLQSGKYSFTVRCVSADGKSYTSGFDAAGKTITYVPRKSADILDSGKCGDNLTWALYKDGTLTISGTGAMNDYSTSNTAPWYSNRTKITSVVLEPGVTVIGKYAFYACLNLASASLPEGLTRVNDYAFQSCAKLAGLSFPSSLTEIGSNAFENCTSLTGISLSQGITEIPWHTFSGCTGLRSVSIPEGLTTIGNSAFSGCSSLQTVNIPTTVTSIEGNAFYNCAALKQITLPEGLTTINYGIFQGCGSLTAVVIPEGVTSISSSAFADCGSLTSITVPDTVSTIGWGVFSDCGSLTAITLPNGLVSLGDNSFRGCKSLKQIQIPEGVTSIGSGAFKDCTSLTDVIIPEGVMSIGSDAFSECGSLTSVVIPQGVTEIGSGLFSGCESLKNVSIPESVTSIGGSAFSGCASLASIAIPKGVTSLGSSVFSGCASLTSVTIPEGVTSLGSYVFYGCTKLTGIVIPQGVTEIGSAAFDDCKSLKSVSIPGSVTTIYSSAFSGCSGLTSLTLSEGLTKIGSNAFYGCTALTSVAVPASVTGIDSWAFSSCSALKKIVFRGHAPTIGGSAFNNVTATAVYPAGDATWTADVRQNYGGTLTWTTENSGLEKPVISSLENVGSGVAVRWNAVPGAARYRVYYKTAGTSWKGAGDTTGTSHTVTGLQSGTRYTFTVRCVSADGKSYTSAYDTAGKSITYLSQPAVSTLENASNGVTVKWNAVPGAARYRVYYKTVGTSWKGGGDTTGTSHTVTGLQSGTAYTFTVRCVSADGKNYTSAYDTKGKTITYTPKASTLANPIISSLGNAAGGVAVKWNAVTGAAKYRVFYKVSGGSWKIVGDTTGTSYTAAGIQSGTRYTFTVRCISADGKSYTSDYDRTGKSITYIAQPAVASAANAAEGVTVKWNAVPGAAKYRVFYKTAGGSWKIVGDTTATSYTVTGLQSGTRYTFTIRCVSSDGKNYTSSYDTAGKSITYIAQPAVSSAENTSGGVLVKWNAVPGAAKYRVFYKTAGASWKVAGDTTAASYTVTGLQSGTAYTFTVRCVSADGKNFTSSYDTKGVTLTVK